MEAATPQEDGWEWAVVEIFGHRRHVGRVREVERFGAKMLRVDIPLRGDPAEHGWTTHFYAGSSIFSFTITDEASALRANTPCEPPARAALPNYRDDDGAGWSEPSDPETGL